MIINKNQLPSVLQNFDLILLAIPLGKISWDLQHLLLENGNNKRFGISLSLHDSIIHQITVTYYFTVGTLSDPERH